LKVRILCWNVNGIRACVKKNFIPWYTQESPDILCLQEIKAQQSQVPPELVYFPERFTYWNPGNRPGYSGVATLSKTKALSVKTGFGVSRFDDEGRVLETEFEQFTLFNIYFPNGQSGGERLQYKLDFYDEALKYFNKLAKKGKKLVICGDYNTAHRAIDLARPKENEKTSGFLPEERAWLDKLVAAGFIDTFRALHPEAVAYSYWDQRTGARARNIGWRIDYHFISTNAKSHLKDAFILPEVMGSDHCPVGLVLEF
jgi:exodeoxyribonuclease-3